MIGRDITQLVSAVPCRREGRRLSVKVSPPYKAWAKRHQQLLRDALRYPGRDIDLTADLSLDDIAALGLIKMENGRFTHPLGDSELVRVLTMPRDEAEDLGASRKRQLQREQHALGGVR